MPHKRHECSAAAIGSPSPWHARLGVAHQLCRHVTNASAEGFLEALEGELLRSGQAASSSGSDTSDVARHEQNNSIESQTVITALPSAHTYTHVDAILVQRYLKRAPRPRRGISRHGLRLRTM